MASTYTECYGTALMDTWARSLLIPYVAKKIKILEALIAAYIRVIDAMRKIKTDVVLPGILGATRGHSCYTENNRG